MQKIELSALRLRNSIPKTFFQKNTSPFKKIYIKNFEISSSRDTKASEFDCFFYNFQCYGFAFIQPIYGSNQKWCFRLQTNI